MTDEQTPSTFADLGLSPAVLAAVGTVGYETPSPIQAQTIPPLLAGRDVVGRAQTGTGKTAAFALPILSRLDLRRSAPQALVLAPTRELALQVCEAFERYAVGTEEVRVLPVYGGQGYGVQLSALRRGVHVVVGTPGRIMDHIDRGTLDLSGIRFLVLDEADEMLNMGFVDDVETILAKTPTEKQVALFSATMPAPIRRIAETYLSDPLEITITRRAATAENISQRFLMVSQHQKVEALTRLLEVEGFEAAIVFARTKQATEHLAERLRARGFDAAAINGDITQPQRERTVAALKDGSLDVLVATDVAARGLDVDRISHVVNFDIPTDAESYVHRIGRTGRAGRSGTAISFVTPRERHLLRQIERQSRATIEQMPMPSVDDVNQTRLSRFDDAITAALDDASRIDPFRDIVQHYVREHDVPELDVAAALAVVMQGDRPLLLEAREELEKVPARDERPRPERPRRTPGGPRRGGDRPMAVYRIQVGKRHRVEPRQIVGAIANEGGLSRDDFGAITIRPDHSLVELPADLPGEVFRALSRTRISGKLIQLAPDGGGSARRAGGRDRPGSGKPGGPGSRRPGKR